jgi:hypothetical protein
MTAAHSALESPLSAKILLPFCYHFWHTSARLETKVGEAYESLHRSSGRKSKDFLSFVGFLNLALCNPPLSAMSTKISKCYWKILNHQWLAFFLSSARVSPVSLFPSDRHFFRAKFELNGVAPRFRLQRGHPYAFFCMPKISANPARAVSASRSDGSLRPVAMRLASRIASSTFPKSLPPACSNSETRRG